MFRIKNSILVCVCILILLAGGCLSICAQTDELALKETSNGFTGTYKSGSQILRVDSSEAADRSLVLKVTSPDGSLVTELTYNNKLVTVTIAAVTIRFRTDKESVESGYFDPLSQSDQAKFEAYRTSEESRVLRKMIIDIIKQRTSTNAASLKGILIISLVLGDGPDFRPRLARRRTRTTRAMTRTPGRWPVQCATKPTNR